MPHRTDSKMISALQAAALQAAGRVETVRQDVDQLRGALEKAFLWHPAAGLKRQCSQALDVIDALTERLNFKLVVTLIGPCGSGKSTLLNALAGVDELSRTGIQRPTTRHLVVLSRDPDDAVQLQARLGDGTVVMRSSPVAGALEHVVLIDTPDTDSTEQERHLALLQRAVTLSDILICVFNAENPKTRDHVDVLAPHVAMFDGQSLVAVLNRCDRLDQDELQGEILPEFERYIVDAWPRPVEQVLCLSARSNLQHPAWDPKASPRHAFDQFESLRELVFGSYNRPGFAADRRVNNAEALRDFIYREVQEQIVRVGPELEKARRRMQTLHLEALKEALQALASRQSGMPAGTSALLYQQLCQRWSGPVGWLVAGWSRLLNLGGSVSQALSPRHLVSRMLRPVGADAASSADEVQSAGAGPAFERYRLAVLKGWPDVAETLVDAGFDPSIRPAEAFVRRGNTIGRDLALIWNTALTTEVERSASVMSNGLLQLLFNLPILAVLAYTGWLTISGFFGGQYLGVSFFLHAAVAAVTVLFMSFFLLQAGLRLLARPERALEKTLETATQQLNQLSPAASNPLENQVAALLDMALPMVAALPQQRKKH